MNNNIILFIKFIQVHYTNHTVDISDLTSILTFTSSAEEFTEKKLEASNTLQNTP